LLWPYNNTFLSINKCVKHEALDRTLKGLVYEQETESINEYNEFNKGRLPTRLLALYGMDVYTNR